MSRPETIERWRMRIQRFDPVNMTVAQFCQSEGVSQPSFYKWKKILRELDRTASTTAKLPEATFVPLHLPATVDGRGDAATEQDRREQVAPLIASTTIELPGGVRIQVQVNTQLTSGGSVEDRS